MQFLNTILLAAMATSTAARGVTPRQDPAPEEKVYNGS
jgi:hypothetical protein